MADYPSINPNRDGDLAVQELRPKMKKPPLYKVILLNDDYTPMDFVVHILEVFFAMPYEMAHRVMWQVHIQGKAVCGTYTREIAETKVAQVNSYAREQQHPLLCTMEQA
jgi:ATP-dependent Clp protease adaptor protein ClpS